jgi:hypothetical protein
VVLDDHLEALDALGVVALVDVDLGRTERHEGHFLVLRVELRDVGLAGLHEGLFRRVQRGLGDGLELVVRILLDVGDVGADLHLPLVLRIGLLALGRRLHVRALGDARVEHLLLHGEDDGVGRFDGVLALGVALYDEP